MTRTTRAFLLLPVALFLGCQQDTLAPKTDSPASGPVFAKPGPTPPPADPAIAFVVGSDIWVMNADGSNQRLVVAGGDAPNFSPDGAQLTFTSSIAGPGVYVINIDGTGLRKVVGTIAGGGPAWSPVPAPDGQMKIAYTDLPGPPDGTLEGNNSDIFLVNLDGTGRVNLTNTRELTEGHPTWSPSATRLAAQPVRYSGTDVGVKVGILVYDLGVVGGSVTITGQTNVTAAGPLSSAYTVFRPAWAKTQDKLAVVVFETGSSLRDIWVIDLAVPANPTNITRTPSVSENMPSWSPNDTRIAYQQLNSKNRPSIFTMNADGSGVTEIGNPSRGLTSQSQPDWRRF